MNELYEFGGSCDVIIRCNNTQTIGSKTYYPNEPYTILTDVYVNITYVVNSSEQNARKSTIAAREGFPDKVQIFNVPLTTKILDLVTSRTDTKNIARTYCAKSIDKRIYLPEIPNLNNLFVYNGEQRIDGIVVENNDIIYSEEFNDEEDYLIFYEVPSSNICFNFDTPYYSYFSLDIIGQGNQDKVTNGIYIKIPACSLMTTGVFDFVQGNILKSPLIFNCIQQNQEKAYFSIT